MGIDSSIDRSAARPDFSSVHRDLSVQTVDLMHTMPRAAITNTALAGLPHVDLIHPSNAGACKVDDPCLKFRPDANSQGAHAQEWRKHRDELKGKPVETDPSGKYEIKPGDSLEGIAQRIAKSRGDLSPHAVQKIEKDLLDANKKDHPKLECNPHYLKPGMKLNVPGDSNKPGESVKPEDSKKPDEQKIDLKPGDPKGSRDAGPLDQVKPFAEACHLDSNRALMDKLVTNGQKLNGDELFGARNILIALSEGNEQGVKDEVARFSNSPQSLDKIAAALGPTLKDSGIDVWYHHIDDMRTNKSTPFLQFYREGYNHDISIGAKGDEVGDAHMNNGGIVMSGPALFGGTYSADAMTDMKNALQKKDCV